MKAFPNKSNSLDVSWKKWESGDCVWETVDIQLDWRRSFWCEYKKIKDLKKCIESILGTDLINRQMSLYSIL